MAVEKLGPYRVVRTIGRGGMGAVYEGVHQETQERVALKILAPAFSDDEAFRARFSGEIEALKILRHPNIVRLIGFGEEEGTLFYAMELVEGESLHEAIRSGKRFTWREVIDIAIQVAGALKHAHDHGIIHRDLKPANLLRTSEGLVKLTDFGIAKLFGSSQLTSVGGVIGTVDYMAPEQAEGTGVTVRSDLYSLGAVMYALLAGRPPFVGRTPTEVFHKMRHHPPPSLRAIQADVPEPLEEIVMELLARDPQQRVATALVLSKRLRAMLYALSEMEQQALPASGGADLQQPPHTSPEASPAPSTPLDVTREFNPDQRQAVSWENETVFTAGPDVQARLPSGESDELKLLPAEERHVSAPRGAARTVAAVERTNVAAGATAAEQTPRTSRYVTATGEATAWGVSWGSWLSFLGIASGLLLTIALALYFQQPPSADKLFARIQAVISKADRGDYMNARQDIDQFLSLYPEDDRARWVRKWQMEHDAYRLWGKLERKARRLGGIDYLPPVERDFVVAMREEGRNMEKAAQLHRTLVDTYGQEAQQSAETATCVEMSRRKLEDLSLNPPGGQDSSQQAVTVDAPAAAHEANRSQRTSSLQVDQTHADADQHHRQGQ